MVGWLAGLEVTKEAEEVARRWADLDPEDREKFRYTPKFSKFTHNSFIRNDQYTVIHAMNIHYMYIMQVI